MTSISDYSENGWPGEAWPVRTEARPPALPLDEDRLVTASRPRRRAHSVLQLVKKALLAVLLAGCLGYGALFALHLAPLVMVTGSMGHKIPAGSLVVDRAIPPSELKVGDVITFQKPIGEHGLDTHRIIGIDSTGPVTRYQTKGDANAEPDPWMISFPTGQKANRVSFHVPYLGWALLYLRMPLVRTLILAAVMLTILTTFLKALGAYGAGTATVTRTKPAKKRKKGKKSKRAVVDLVPAEVLAAELAPSEVMPAELALANGGRTTKALAAPIEPSSIDGERLALAPAEAWAAELWPAEEAAQADEPVDLEPADPRAIEWPREDWPELVWPEDAAPAELMPADVWPTEVVSTRATPSEVWPEEVWPETLPAAEGGPTDVWPTEAWPTQLALEAGAAAEVSPPEPEPSLDHPAFPAAPPAPYAWRPSEPEPFPRWRPGLGMGFALGLAAMLMARRKS